MHLTDQTTSQRNQNCSGSYDPIPLRRGNLISSFMLLILDGKGGGGGGMLVAIGEEGKKECRGRKEGKGQRGNELIEGDSTAIGIF